MKHNQQPASVSEAVGIVLMSLSDEDKARIARMNKYELVTLHFDLGIWIRNRFCLWQENSALKEAIRKSFGSGRPDFCSEVIIEALWDHLNDMETQ